MKVAVVINDSFTMVVHHKDENHGFTFVNKILEEDNNSSAAVIDIENIDTKEAFVSTLNLLRITIEKTTNSFNKGTDNIGLN